MRQNALRFAPSVLPGMVATAVYAKPGGFAPLGLRHAHAAEPNPSGVDRGFRHAVLNSSIDNRVGMILRVVSSKLRPLLTIVTCRCGDPFRAAYGYGVIAAIRPIQKLKRASTARSRGAAK